MGEKLTAQAYKLSQNSQTQVKLGKVACIAISVLLRKAETGESPESVCNTAAKTTQWKVRTDP